MVVDLQEGAVLRAPSPILTSHLFRELDGHLVDLLGSLASEDWGRPTVCSAWTVKDVASHLLDTALRRLSMQRDGYFAPGAPAVFEGYEGLVSYVHRLNAEWTSATSRLSPRVLIDMTRRTTSELADLFEAADPSGPALFPVAWAGEQESAMWFDMAREFTERWHHQRQIADAVDRETPIDSRRLYHPVLDTFLRALPHAYRNVDAPEGSLVCVRIAGEAGGAWFLRRRTGAWDLLYEVAEPATAVVAMDQDVAWKFLTKRTSRTDARARFPSIRLEGDQGLGEPALEIVSILA